MDLIFDRTGDSLAIQRFNSNDSVTVQNWYVGADDQIESIQAGDGSVLANQQVQQLIQAMAGFTTQTGLTWGQGIAQRPQDVQAILAANWQPTEQH